MSNVSFSAAAADDLNDIWDYTAEEWGIDQAERYTDGIQDICNSLARGEKHGYIVVSVVRVFGSRGSVN